ncbi:hypothetical protein ISCGN_014785 [Ixodes scapularis]
MHEGLYIGKINTYAHQVSGHVYAIDEYTILIKNFFYDGLGQDTFFWAGSSVRPSNVGFIVPDEEGKIQPEASLASPRRARVTSFLAGHFASEELVMAAREVPPALLLLLLDDNSSSGCSSSSGSNSSDN